LGQKFESIDELIRLGLLPNEFYLPIDNLYTRLRPSLKNNDKFQDPPSNLDGILISHPHKDHYLGLSFVNRTIPIYTGLVTKRIILAFNKTSKISIDNYYNGLNWKTFRTGDLINIKGLKIVPYHVDHSIPAAYGFIIYSSSGPIVYTGDFRMHGPLSHMSKEFINEIKSHQIFISKGKPTDQQLKQLSSHGIKLLIIEGTKICKSTIESENLVEKNLLSLFENNPFDYIIVKYDRIDWDRFRTISSIAKKYNWKFIIDEKDAYFYYLLNQDEIYETMKNPNIINDDHILIIKFGNARFKWQEEIRQALYTQDKGFRFIDYRQIKDMKEKFFIYMNWLNENIIKNLNPNSMGMFISSNLDPYAEEFFDNTDKFYNRFLELGIPTYKIHASGHAAPHDIINFVKQVKPENLIPIHTSHKKFFKELFKSSDIKIHLLDYNDSFEI
ncbi:MAG: MBL fold metallo-hydrolase, partial [Promethearchaeota archaeon]